MGYLGLTPTTAQQNYLNIDDISGSFNGTTTSFALQVGGVAPTPFPVTNSCLISVGGVIQQPDDTGTDGFRISGGNIIFSSAPGTGEDFFGLVLAGADYLNVGANFPDGTVGTPSITFESDLNTGIYHPSADSIAITSGGTAALTIDSNQRVGVGTSSPAHPLHVSASLNDAVTNIVNTDTTNGYGLSVVAGGSASGRYIARFADANNSAKAIVLANGSVGIGTTSPDERLVVSGGCLQVRGFLSSVDRPSSSVMDFLNGATRFFSIGADSSTHGQFVFNTSTTTTVSERARIDTSGRLLVGTSTATGNNKLQVSGDALIHGLTLGQGNVTNNNNTAFGFEALANNTNYNNTALGFRALKSNTSGGRNTAIGLNALRDHTTGTNNTAIGCDALYQQTGASYNTAVGDQAGKSVSSGQQNVLVGMFAGQDINTGNNNTCVGYGAGYGMTSGYNNVCIGNLAGNYTTTITTGTNNIMIGERPTPSASNGTHQINIATSAGTQGKGNNTAFITPNAGACYQGNNSSSWSTTSDRRLKKNIIDNTEGLDIINQVRVVNFEYRLPEEIEETELQGQALLTRNEDDEILGPQGVKLGVIAQELQQVCSDCVKEESTGVMSVVDDNLFWHMVNAVKELSAQNAALEARLTALEGT